MTVYKLNILFILRPLAAPSWAPIFSPIKASLSTFAVDVFFVSLARGARSSHRCQRSLRRLLLSPLSLGYTVLVRMPSTLSSMSFRQCLSATTIRRSCQHTEFGTPSPPLGHPFSPKRDALLGRNFRLHRMNLRRCWTWASSGRRNLLGPHRYTLSRSPMARGGLVGTTAG